MKDKETRVMDSKERERKLAQRARKRLERERQSNEKLVYFSVNLYSTTTKPECKTQ